MLKRFSKKHIQIVIVNDVVRKAPPLTSWITIPRKKHEKGIEHKEAVAAESLLLKLVIGRYNREHHDNADNEINVVITALMIVVILVNRKGPAGSNLRKLEENIPRQQYCQQAVIL